MHVGNPHFVEVCPFAPIVSLRTHVIDVEGDGWRDLVAHTDRELIGVRHLVDRSDDAVEREWKTELCEDLVEAGHVIRSERDIAGIAEDGDTSDANRVDEGEERRVGDDLVVETAPATADDRLPLGSYVVGEAEPRSPVVAVVFETEGVLHAVELSAAVALSEVRATGILDDGEAVHPIGNVAQHAVFVVIADTEVQGERLPDPPVVLHEEAVHGVGNLERRDQIELLNA